MITLLTADFEYQMPVMNFVIFFLNKDIKQFKQTKNDNSKPTYEFL